MLGRNGVSARKGIDTFKHFRCKETHVSRRNGALARKGIDTRLQMPFHLLIQIVEMEL